MHSQQRSLASRSRTKISLVDHPSRHRVRTAYGREKRGSAQSARKRTQPHTVNPYDREWIDTGLKEFAARAQAGEDPKELQAELLTALWPWATRTADRLASRVPADADRDAVRSEVLWELYQSILRIDWDRYELWPALLKCRIRGAFTTAARAEDPLTRGQRKARTTFLALEEQTEQSLGRMLSPAERAGLAARLGPKGGAYFVLHGFQRPTSIDRVESALVSAPAGPEETVMRRCDINALRDWLADDVPPELARSLSDLLLRDANSLPAGMRARLKPYLPALQRRLAASFAARPCTERGRAPRSTAHAHARPLTHVRKSA